MTKAQKARNRAKKQRDKARNRRLMHKNGLQPPTNIRVGTPEYQALQDKWYSRVSEAEAKKPEDERFKDIEWQENPNSPFLKQSGAKPRLLTPGKQLYYALCRNYLTHARRALCGMDRRAWELHADGLAYRKILKTLRREYRLKKSIYWIYYYVKGIEARMYQWNRVHAEGMLNPASTDGFADDALISDFGLSIAQPYELSRPTED